MSRDAHSLTAILRRPLLGVAAFWMTGILLAPLGHGRWWGWGLVALVGLLGWGASRRQRPGLARVALVLAITATGACRYTWQITPPPAAAPTYLPSGGVHLRGYALAPPTRGAYGWHLPFRLQARTAAGRWQRAYGDIYLYGAGVPPPMGRRAQVLGRVRPAPPPQYPGAFSWTAYLAAHGWRYRVQAVQVHLLSGASPGGGTRRLAATLRRRTMAAMPPAYAALRTELLFSVLFGLHGADLPAVLIEHFRRAGTLHLMVVSGGQIALLCAILLWPLGVLPEGRRMTTYPGIRIGLLVSAWLVVGGYTVLADRGPSVTRALLMGALVGGATLLMLSPIARRRAFHLDGLSVLAAAIVISLLVNPAQLFNPGWQLSFAAVAGLLIITPLLVRVSPVPAHPVTLLIAATLGAQLFTAPILAWHFGSLPVLAPVTNLVAVPVVALLMPLGILSLLWTAVLPGVAGWFAIINAGLLDVLVGVSVEASNCRWALLPWSLHSPWGVLGYLVGVGLVLRQLQRWAVLHTPPWPVPAGREPRLW